MTSFKLWSLTLVVVASLLLGACGPSAAPTEEPAAPEPTAEAAAPEPIEALEPEPEPTEPLPPTEPAAEEPSVLRVGIMADVDCWNPYVCISFFYYGHHTTEGFTEHGPFSTGCDGVPRLAESWEVSDDGLTWTLKFHEGITFSDGTPFTAQTAADYLEWLSASPMGEAYAEAMLLESTEVVDDLTLSYTTVEPILNSPDYDWQWMYVVPPHIWTELGDDGMFEYENFPPVGTGPYVVTEHEPGSHFIMEAREDYYLGKPPIDQVIYQIYSNPEAIVSALKAGEIDATTVFMPPEAYDALAGEENITVDEKDGGTTTNLFFNMAAGGAKHPAIDDPAVREAIDYAIDKENLVEVALLGHGITCPSNWKCGPAYADELNPDLVVTPFDTDKANQILDEAGYADTDGDGIRETPDGEPLSFRLTYQVEYPYQLTMADMMGTWFADIGVEIMPEAQDLGTWMANVVEIRGFDMAMFLDTGDVDPAVLDYSFSCWAAEAGAGALNFAGYCNEEVDELNYAFWFSDDPEGRWEYQFEAQRILNQDRPLIMLAGNNMIQAYRSDRFELPTDMCDVSMGMVSPAGLLGAETK